MKTALVITTYNNPEFLGLCLESLTNQTEKSFQIFIADDGSTSETKSKIESFKNRFQNPIEHVWHEDEGYRKAKINNLVFKKLDSFDIIICIDHDVILHHQFIEDHIQIHKKNKNLLFMGRRIDLSEKLTKTITEKNVIQFNQGLSLSLLISGLRGETKNVLRSIRIQNPLLQKIFKRNRVNDLLGSNFSVTKKLLFAVNGYNEDHQSYWGEDGDLFVRLRNAGATLLGSKSYAIQYHLHHPRLIQTPEQEAHYAQTLQKTDYVRCKNGIY